MKIRNFFLAIIVLIGIYGICAAENPFVATKEGMKMEYVNKNKDGKITGYSLYTVRKVKEEGSSIEVEILNEEFDYDKKPRGLSGVMIYYIEDDKVIFDLAKMMAGMSYSGDQSDVRTVLEGDAVSYPTNLQTGTQLPELNMKLFIKSEAKSVKMCDIKMYDRKVEKREKLSTPAGAFDCVVIIETTMMNMPIIPKEISSERMWYADGIGEVYSESYSKKGKLESTSELISVEMP